MKINEKYCNAKVSPLSWIHCGLLVDFIQDLQYLGQVVLVGLELWLWL